MHQSIPSANTPSPGRPIGGIFEVVKSPAMEQNSYLKTWAWGAEKVPTKGNILEDLDRLSC